MNLKQGLFNKNFILLNLVLFLAYCNITIFFQFPFYLQYKLQISPEWIGIIVSIFSLTGLILRPFISAVIIPSNARKVICISAICLIISLLLYSFAFTIKNLLIIRVIHGIAYVVFGTAIFTEIVASVPANQSGQAFSIIGIITLLPFAVMPPLLKPLTSKYSFVSVLTFFGILLFLTIVIIPFLDKFKNSPNFNKKDMKISKKELMANITDGNLIILFTISLLLFTSFSATFFYIKGYSIKNHIPNPGWFFTVATAMEIGVRIFLGKFFDKTEKIPLLGISMVIMAIAFFLLSFKCNITLFLITAAMFGFGMGISMPLINSLIFDFSSAKLRSFNSNLGIEMFQGGFFIGSLMGGIIISYYSYKAIFLLSGFLSVFSILLIIFLYLNKRKEVKCC